jgi:uncharacterized protein YjbI with pentapeptide repeats
VKVLRAPVLLLFIFAVVVAVSVAQSEGDGREVVQANEILEKIERGEPVEYDHVLVEGDLDLGKLDLPKRHVNRNWIEIGVLRLSENATIVSSPIRVSDSIINGNISFSNAIFGNTVDLKSSHFNGIADFRGSNFAGIADFWGSDFNGDADFGGSDFYTYAYFGDSDFYGYAYFRDSDFYGNAYFYDSDFNKDADFAYAQIYQSAYFGGGKFEKNAIFDWSYLQFADFNQTAISGDLSLKGSQIGSLALTDAELGEIVLRSWKSIGHMEYDEMAYQLLLSSFRNRNLPDEANQCYYDYREGRRATLSKLRQPADYALMLFYGYGVKPERPVIWAFVFMAIFAALFWWRQGIIPVQKGEPEEEANSFTLPEAMAFSAMTFLSGGKLVFDPPEYRIAPGKPWRDVQICKALFVWERLMGMMLLFMFAVAVTKTIILS